MNLLDELRSLDPRDPGRWPLAFRAGVVGVCFVLLSLLAIYFFVWTDLNPQLESLQNQEDQLRNEYRTKHAKATNLEVYKQQLADIEKSFGAMLRQLPSKTEVESVLVDISQAGLASALDQRLFQPDNEMKKDFYAEKSIKIRFSGSYHQFGQFVSNIAALPRIVTLHDVKIGQATKTAVGGTDQLQMDLVAKTYRYLDDEEVAAAEAERRKSEKAAARPQG